MRKRGLGSWGLVVCGRPFWAGVDGWGMEVVSPVWDSESNGISASLGKLTPVDKTRLLSSSRWSRSRRLSWVGRRDYRR